MLHAVLATAPGPSVALAPAMALAPTLAQAAQASAPGPSVALAPVMAPAPAVVLASAPAPAPMQVYCGYNAIYLCSYHLLSMIDPALPDINSPLSFAQTVPF